ncbi:MAG: phosphotransferase [Dehalococcoidales bacterium]|nr:MAG: phosphotransferase [Dehalococcoidales bacterium]
MITNPENVTSEWLTDVLRQAGSLQRGEVIGVRVISESSNTAKIGRLTLTYSDIVPSTTPTHLFLKVSDPHSKTPVVGSEQRRCEVEFHNSIATLMPDPPVIRCHHAVYCEETGISNLIFDDVSETHFAGKSTIPPPARQAEKAVDAFSEFHAFWWDHQTLGDTNSPQNQTSVTEDVNNIREHFPRFADFLGDRLTVSQRQVYENTLTLLPSLMERVARGKDLTLIHGDSDLSNVLLPHDPDTDKALIIDWQLWGISFAAEDLAHLIALFWEREHRQRMEKHLLKRYHRGLIRHGVKNYEWIDCWNDYRLAVILRVLFMPMWFWRNGAPASMWERSFMRAMQAFEDLGCQELLER